VRPVGIAADAAEIGVKLVKNLKMRMAQNGVKF